jgi:hypothetical protein
VNCELCKENKMTAMDPNGESKIVETKVRPARSKVTVRRDAPAESSVDVLLRIEQALLRLGEMVATSGRDQDSQIAALRSLGHDWPRIGELVGLKANAARMRLSRGRSSSVSMEENPDA